MIKTPIKQHEKSHKIVPLDAYHATHFVVDVGSF